MTKPFGAGLGSRESGVGKEISPEDRFQAPPFKAEKDKNLKREREARIFKQFPTSSTVSFRAVSLLPTPYSLLPALRAFDVSYSETTEAGHHRIEHRQIWVVSLNQVPNLPNHKKWKGLASIVMVRRRRLLWNKETERIPFTIN